MSESGPAEVPLQQLPTIKSTISQRRAPEPFHTTSHTTHTQHDDERASPKPAGGRRKEEAANRARDDENETHLNEMGKIYEKILTYGTRTRYSIYILPVAIVLMISATQVSSDPRKDLKIGGVRGVWLFTWFEGVWFQFLGH